MSNMESRGIQFEARPLVVPETAHPFWTFARVAGALGGGPSSPEPLAGISTDTRGIRRGDVFVALKGEHYDAHNFLAAARDAGAAALVVSDAMDAAGLALPTYVVPDTLVALGKLASEWRSAWAGTVVAVAGSNGKTSTKELLRAMLGRTFRVHATSGNENNLVGVPLSLLAIPPSAELAVIELGTNAPGEIARLRAIARPDVAVLTSIGEEHLEGLGDMAGVLQEECEVFRGATLAVLPHVFTEALALARERSQAVISTGLDREAQYSPDEWGVDDRGHGWFIIDGERFSVPVAGGHQLANAVLAAAVSRACSVLPSAAAAGLADMVVPRMRGTVEAHGSALVINDAYNANPPSMRAALALLDSMASGRQKVAFLGTMRELGAHSRSQHELIAQAAMDSSADLIVGVGEFAVAFQALFSSALSGVKPRVVVAADPVEAWQLASPRIDRNAVLLLKASRGVRMEQLLPRISAWAD